MRMVFFGSGEFGLPTLSALLAAGHEIPAVVSQPPRPAGRGGKMAPTPVAAFAAERGLPVLAPEKPNTPAFEAGLRALAPELCVVVAYGHLIRRALLAVPPRGFVNLHASLLPAYRGAAPAPWAILSGETKSGATVFLLDEKFDTGAILGSAALPIAPDDTSGTYLAKLAPRGAELMTRTVADIAAGRAVPRPQDNAKSSAAPKFSKEDGRIDWSLPFEEIERKVRAFQPWPQAFTLLETPKGEVRVNVVKIAPAPELPCSLPVPGARPGAVLACDVRAGLVIATGTTPARLSLLQPQGKKPMPDTDFLRGTKVVKEKEKALV